MHNAKDLWATLDSFQNIPALYIKTIYLFQVHANHHLHSLAGDFVGTRRDIHCIDNLPKWKFNFCIKSAQHQCKALDQ